MPKWFTLSATLCLCILVVVQMMEVSRLREKAASTPKITGFTIHMLGACGDSVVAGTCTTSVDCTTHSGAAQGEEKPR